MTEQKPYGEVMDELDHAAKLAQEAPASHISIPVAPNTGRYLAETNDGRLLYLNHAGQWQEMPNILALKEKGGVNHATWLRNALQFIEERKLSSAFRDWCGGWPCPVKPGKNESLAPALADEVTLPAGVARAAALALRSYENGNAATALAGACAAELEKFVGSLMPPAPDENARPQGPEEILETLIGDIVNFKPGEKEGFRAFCRNAVTSCGAAMAMLHLWRWKEGR